jgi:glycosyltransferase involved in cell wall biosynthesis
VKLLVVMAHASPWSLDIAASLRERGHEIHVLDFESPDDDHMPAESADTRATLAGFASVTLLPRSTAGWRRILDLSRAMRACARRLRIDVMLCLYGGRFSCAAWLSGVRPYAVYVVGSDVLLAGRALRLINRFALAVAARVFANGAHLAAAARRQSPGATVENLLIGVDSEQLQPVPRGGPARLFNHRWFAPIYNNETILHALALLPPDLPPFEMTFASGGPDLPAARALAGTILPPRLRAAVRFEEGKLSREALLARLARSDVFISMARSDGTPISVLEAMTSGVFPVLSDIPANRELLDVGRGIGALVATEDPAALAAELARRIAQVEQCRELAPSIRAHVVRFASSSVTRARLAEQLHSIANSRETSRYAA